jgi:peptidoglycan/LPS O-acetylase OafA/YrhL
MKLREIERLRAFAALLVLGVHWSPLWKLTPPLLQYPWSGVDLFFVISGYVVTLSLVRLLPPLEAEASPFTALQSAREALRTFYVRRFFRIMPAALSVALLTGFLTTAFPQEFGTTRAWEDEFVAFFGGVYNYYHAFHGHLHLNVYWSLAVEEHFYLLLPVMFVTLRTTPRRLAGCLALALFSIVARALPLPTDPDVDAASYEMFCSHLRFDSLMAGVALALFSMPSTPRLTPVMPRSLMRVLVLPAVMALVACLPEAVPSYVGHREGFIALWMLSGVLVSYAAMDRGYVLALPGVDRVFEFLGARSYAIYLLHQLVARVEISVRDYWPRYARFAPDSDHPWTRLGVLIVVTLAAVEVLHRLIERPFIEMGRRLIESPGTLHVSNRVKGLAAAGLVAIVAWAARHPLLVWLGPPNVARGKTVTVSSQMEDKPGPHVLVNGALEPSFGLHTKEEESPWALIDLGAPSSVRAIRVYNREDGYQNQQLPLEVSVSLDGETFSEVARRETMFTQAFPWAIRLDGTPVRFVKLQVMRKSVLCLSEVEVYESPTPAKLP